LLPTEAELVKLVNPISKNMDTMRPSQIPGLLKNLVENFRNQRNRINLFEIGNVFFNKNVTPDQKPTTLEREVLSIISFGSRFSEQWGYETKNVDFFDLKNLLSVLLPNCKLELVGFSNENKILHPTRSAEILHLKEDNLESDVSSLSNNLRKIGVIGELHPVLYKKLNLPFVPVVLEIDLKYAVSASDVSYNIISKVPFVRRDLAFLMDKDLKVGVFLEGVFRQLKNKNNAEIVKEIHPYDVYEGEDLPSGKKSITFRVILQEFGKTLEDVVVDDLINSIVDTAKNNYDTQLRG
jgi:phenylalanyl-tRNA synthetase beta chain